MLPCCAFWVHSLLEKKDINWSCLLLCSLPRLSSNMTAGAVYSLHSPSLFCSVLFCSVRCRLQVSCFLVFFFSNYTQTYIKLDITCILFLMNAPSLSADPDAPWTADWWMFSLFVPDRGVVSVLLDLFFCRWWWRRISLTCHILPWQSVRKCSVCLFVCSFMYLLFPSFFLRERCKTVRLDVLIWCSRFKVLMKNLLHFSLVCVCVCQEECVLFLAWLGCVCVCMCLYVSAHVWGVLSTSVNLLKHNSLTSTIFVAVHTVDLCILVVK